MTAPRRRPLHCRHAPAACHRPAPGQPEAPPSATMGALAEAVGILVARAEGIPLGLSGGVPAPAVVGALTILAAAFLSHLDLADGGARLLADLGRAAAREEAR